MPRPATEPIADVIRIIARQYGWEDRFLAERAKVLILELIPEEIRPHVLQVISGETGVAADKSIFYLKTDSAAARTNLSYALPRIIEEANARLGAPVVKVLRLL